MDLITRNSRRIVAAIDTEGMYGRDLLKGLTKFSRLYGPWRFYRIRQINMIDLSLIKKWKPDGIIIHAQISKSSKTKVLQLLESKLPAVISSDEDEIFQETTTIFSDRQDSGSMAAEHLLERGFKNFAFYGLKGFSWSTQRCEAFEKRIIEAAPEHRIYKKLVSYKNSLFEFDALAKQINSLPKPLGVMTCNDDFAQNLMEACQNENIDIPEEVAFVGCDNNEIVCEISDPPLSSVFLDVEQAGYDAAALLDKMISGEAPKTNSIIARARYVVTRQSSDIFAIEDKTVLDALRYIRENAQKPITVDGVVEVTGASRRDLYYRFKKTIGHSILHEIKRVRADEIARFLRETDMTITEIAYRLDFSDTSHLSRYFRQQKKENPSHYRARTR